MKNIIYTRVRGAGSDFGQEQQSALSLAHMDNGSIIHSVNWGAGGRGDVGTLCGSCHK